MFGLLGCVFIASRCRRQVFSSSGTVWRVRTDLSIPSLANVCNRLSSLHHESGTHAARVPVLTASKRLSNLNPSGALPDIAWRSAVPRTPATAAARSRT